MKGKVIFEDTFADDAGGWLFDGIFLIFKAPGADVEVKQNSAIAILNQTFNASGGDYCVEIAFPVDQAVKGFSADLKLLNSDRANYFSASLYNDGTVAFYRHVASGFTTLWSVDQKANAKLGPGEFNSIEAIVKGNLISVVLNGKAVKAVRAQIPAGDLQFGFQVGSGVDAKDPSAFALKSFKVTEAQ